jgi:co-chaperonin GroES (HSP10)
MTDKLTAASEIKSIEPAPNCLVVRLLDQSGVSRGGILLPEIRADAPGQGIVVYVGELIWQKDIKFNPKPGDRISMKRFGFSEILVNGETLRQISIGDVLGILK